MFRTGLALFAVVALAALPANSHAQPKNSGSVVKATATADKPDANGKQTVTFTLTIEKPWHIYANPVGIEDLATAATVVEITGKMKPKSVKVDYPKGTVEKDKDLGNYMIYEGKIVIKAEVVRAKGDTGPLKASIAVQACKTGANGTCLLPSAVEIEVP